ncbi:ABC transporter permease [Luethyella okanaganae]|uniref:ABC transporter permease n=1 Tax=Luethyella okanaganae TaxID=69372 RepID=A0ABW1VID7_9MICO
MNRAFTGIVGAVSEAWQELRIHRTRVLLSLIGVAVAVCALTTVVGLGGLAQQANLEVGERMSGRPATLYVQAGMTDGSTVNPVLVQRAWNDSLERYGVTYASRVVWGQQTVQFVDGAVPVQTRAVDQPYGTMHRVELDRGAWFDAADGERLAPALIVNEVFWRRIGSPDLATHPVVSLLGEQDVSAVVTGVYPAASWETGPAMYMLFDVYERLAAPLAPNMRPPPQYELWVPPQLSDAIGAGMRSDIAATLGEGASVTVNRQDVGAFGDDPFLPLKLMVGGVAILVLLLGALGLVNIALVTVKQRIREIGIRRSFGATAGRVFFAVMMESVVGTVAAGAVGVMAAILIVKSKLVEGFIGQGMVTDFPPFPVEAAVIGLLAATLVGTVAGLLPALVAVRVKVIDAIRY